MTLETLYRKDLDEAKLNYKNRMLTPLAPYKDLGVMPTEIVSLLTYQKILEKKKSDLTHVNIPPMSFDVNQNITAHFDKLDSDTINQRAMIKDEYETRKQQMQTDYEDQMSHQHEYNESLINPYREKHMELLQYKDDLKHVCDRYNISPLDMNISDTITADEFGTLIDESLNICERYKSKDYGYFAKAISPLQGETSFEFVLCYVVMVVAVLYFLLPVVSIAVFGYMIAMVHGLYRDLEKLKIAVALMSQLDYNRFVDDQLLAPPEQPDFEAVDKEMFEKINSVEDHTEERCVAMEQTGSFIEAVSKECAQTTKEVLDEYTAINTALVNRLKEVDDKIHAFLKDYKPFPTVCNQSVVMSHTYVLGRIEDRLDVSATLPLQNIVFDCTDRERAINIVKLYLCNALLSVRVKQLTVDIYDPQNQGRDFAEFFDKSTSDYIKPNEKPLDKLIEEFRSYAQDNIKKLNHKDIDTFNKEAEEKEMIPLGYRLLIMVSEFDRWKKDKEETGRVFKEFFKYSAENGVMIWLLDTNKWGGSVWVDGSYNATEGHALEYDLPLGATATNTYITALATYKDRGISYTKNFADKYIPRDKWWTWNTIEGVDLHFGLADGDPAKGYPIQLNDGNVHALCAGATGAGKSALISALLTALITKYPPSELEIIYIDFKNSEANKLTENGFSVVPHLRIISGTTDGGYALSIFEYLISELTARQKICAKYKEVNLKDLRKRHPEVVVPRLLVLFDEFQVMYNTEYVPQRTIDSINAKITAFTKLARAYGGHLLFTSQSMKGTMSQDTMSNFSLRAALRCTAEVSEQILGNKAASTITAKFGYMYTNTSAGQDAKFNQRWRVPFIDVPEMLEIVGELNKMCEERGEKHWHAEFYDEKQLVPAEKLNEWYEEYREFDDPEVVILGERAAYSTNKAPLTLTLMQDSKENVLLGAFEREDLLNLVLTFVDNLKRKENCRIIMHVADKDSHRLLGVEDIVEEDLLDISRPEQDVIEFLQAIIDLVNYRFEIGGPYEPVYVFCVGWEVAPGIGVEQNYKGVEAFKPVLNKAPSVGVHFIFALKSKPLDSCSFIPNACSHRIVGLMPSDAPFFIDTSAVEKLPDKDKDAGLFAIYKYGTNEQKFRIYQHKFKGTIKSREVIIK